MQKYLKRILPIFLVLAGQERAIAAGFDLPLTGRLTEKNGKPVDGPVELSISFFHVSRDGTPVLTVTEGLGSVTLQEGIFQVSVNLSGSDWQHVFPSADQPVFIEITDLTHAAGTPYPRFQVAMAPLAGKVPVDGKTIAFDGEGRAGLVVAGTQGAGKLLSSDGAGALTWTDPPPTTVTQVSGVSAANVAAGATAANEASSASAVGTIVKRDANGGFAASTVAAQNVILTAPTAASKPLSVKGAAGQTANLQEWLSSTGALLAGVSADGALKLGSGAQSVSLKAPSGMVSSTSYVLPAAPDDGKFLMTDANGNLSWSAPTIASAGLAPSLGSEGAPSYSFSGDANTGFWSSGADTVNVSTGGAERLRVDASGRVGVGTTTPLVTLEVKSSAFSALTGTVDVTAGTTTVVGTGTSFTTETAVGDALRIGTQTLTVAAVADDTHLTINAAHTAGATAAVAFTDAGLLRVRNAAGTAKLTVNKSGNVGVGALSPEQKLTVDGTLGLLEGGASPTFHTIFQGGDQAANITYTLPTAQGATGTILTNNGSGVLSWSGATVPGSGTLSTVSGTETLTNKTLTAPVISTISNTGVLTLPTSTDTLVGRDTTDTLTNKTLTAPTINGGTMNASSGAVATPSYSFSGDANTGMWSSAADTVNFSTAGSERLRISSSGNVGIGTTSPTQPLTVAGIAAFQQVGGTAGTDEIQITHDGTNGLIDSKSGTLKILAGGYGAMVTPQFWFGTGQLISSTSGALYLGDDWANASQSSLKITGDSGGPLLGTVQGGHIRVSTDLNIAGNVGIGTTSPSAKLSLQGTSGAQTLLRIAQHEGSATFVVGYNGGTDGYLKMPNVDGSERLNFQSGGYGSTGLLTLSNSSLNVSGNVGIGSTLPIARLDVRTSAATDVGLAVTAAASQSADLQEWRNSAGTPLTWIDASGHLVLGNQPNSGVPMRISPNAPIASYSSVSFYPDSGTNVAGDITVSPRGTGAANGVRSQFSIMNTDVVADPVNYEFFAFRAVGSRIAGATGKSGTGSNRPIMFAAGYASDGVTNDGQFYLATSGNVGIGTTSPAYALDVNGTVRATNFIATSGSNDWSGSNFSNMGNISVDGTAAHDISQGRNTGTSAGSSLTVKAGGAVAGGTDKNGGNLILSSGIATGSGASSIQFQTSGAGGSGTSDVTPATRMTIDGNGRVGIGMTPVGYGSLEVAGSVAGLGGFNARVGGWNMQLGATAKQLDVDGVNKIKFGGNEAQAVPAIVIDSGVDYTTQNILEIRDNAVAKVVVGPEGNLGIGTTSPAVRLQVNNDSSATANTTLATFKDADTTGGYFGQIDFGSTNVPASGSAFIASSDVSNSGLTLRTRDGSGVNGDRMVITGAGNVGVGTTAPARKLEVNAGSTAGELTALRLTHGGNAVADNVSLEFFPASAALTAKAKVVGIAPGSSDVDLAFHTVNSNAAAEAMRITGDGNVGIGVTAPSARLQVAGAIVSTTNPIASGAAVDLSLSNTHTLASVGGATIALTNPVDGGAYTLVVTDTTSRTYTFSGCTTSYFRPANAATTGGSRTIYGILTIKNGSDWDCYINWTGGYQ